MRLFQAHLLILSFCVGQSARGGVCSDAIRNAVFRIPLHETIQKLDYRQEHAVDLSEPDNRGVKDSRIWQGSGRSQDLSHLEKRSQDAIGAAAGLPATWIRDYEVVKIDNPYIPTEPADYFVTVRILATGKDGEPSKIVAHLDIMVVTDDNPLANDSQKRKIKILKAWVHDKLQGAGVSKYLKVHALGEGSFLGDFFGKDQKFQLWSSYAEDNKAAYDAAVTKINQEKTRIQEDLPDEASAEQIEFALALEDEDFVTALAETATPSGRANLAAGWVPDVTFTKTVADDGDVEVDYGSYWTYAPEFVEIFKWWRDQIF